MRAGKERQELVRYVLDLHEHTNTYSEWMIHFTKNILLILNVINMLALNNLVLLHRLDSKLL